MAQELLALLEKAPAPAPKPVAAADGSASPPRAGGGGGGVVGEPKMVGAGLMVGMAPGAFPMLVSGFAGCELGIPTLGSPTVLVTARLHAAGTPACLLRPSCAVLSCHGILDRLVFSCSTGAPRRRAPTRWRRQ